MDISARKRWVIRLRTRFRGECQAFYTSAGLQDSCGSLASHFKHAMFLYNSIDSTRQGNADGNIKETYNIQSNRKLLKIVLNCEIVEVGVGSLVQPANSL
jgi:hypothetical protein